MSTPAFDFPSLPGDRLLSGAGAVERLIRGVVRRLRSGGFWQRGDLGRLQPPHGPSKQWEPPHGNAVLLLGAVPWSYRFQRPQQLAVALCRLGHAVLYVEAFGRQLLQPLRQARQEPGGPTVLRLRLPGRPDPYREALGGEAAEGVAARLAGGVRRPTTAIVAQLPFWDPVARRLRDRLGAPLLYDRIDLHSGFPGIPRVVEESEGRLLREADLVTYSSRELMEGSPVSRTEPGRALLLPNAAALEDFPPAPTPPAGGVVVGYVGALGPWVDAEAVAGAAQARPDWRFELAGRVESVEVAALARLRNVRLLGEIPYSRVPSFLAGLHAALIPFRELPLTRAVDPVKLYEALAVGVPVVAADLPGVASWSEPLVYRYRRPEELSRALGQAVSADDAGLRRRRRAAVEEETWERRARALLAAVADLR